jgi:hypothetical protein
VITFSLTNNDRLLITHQTRSPIPSNQTTIAPHTQEPDRLFSQIKQRSPHNTHKPDRLNLKIKQRSPLHHPKPDRLNLNIKQRSPLTTHKPRSPNPPNQTAIAPQHPKPDRLNSTSNSDRLTTHKPRSPISHIKQRSPSLNPLKNHLINIPQFFLACE